MQRRKSLLQNPQVLAKRSSIVSNSIHGDEKPTSIGGISLTAPQGPTAKTFRRRVHKYNFTTNDLFCLKLLAYFLSQCLIFITAFECDFYLLFDCDITILFIKLILSISIFAVIYYVI